MGTAPTPVLVSSYGTGNSADGQIIRDAIDDLIGGMSSKLLIYLRAKKIVLGTGSFSDALGNAVTNSTTSATKNDSDPNFNGHASISFANNNNPFTMVAGGIGLGTPPVTMTNSFTIMAGVRFSSSAAQSLYGDNAGTNGSSNVTGFYFDTTGTLKYQLGASSFQTLGGVLLAPSTTGVIWISFDAATSILRAGVNTGTVASQATTAYTRTSASTSTTCIPFGLSPSGTDGYQSWNRWTLWNKAFVNGAVPSDDAAFTNLITNYAAYI